jgi:phage terminase large subunit-like protein
MVPKSAAPHDVAGFDPVATAGDCWYDEEAAEKAVRFIGKLKHTKGKWAGQPVTLEPWQLAFIRTLFGWKRPDGTRRFRTAFLFIPRKNGKSFLAAAIALYVLFCDGEAEAECYCAASDREQASLVFKAAASMVRKERVLDSACKIRDSTRRIVYGESVLRAIPANEGGSHGFNAHLIVGDELHTWPNRDFYDTLHTSTGAREQPLEVYITTAGHDDQSICHEVYKRAVAVRDGQVEDQSFLPAIYEAGPDDDWNLEETWRKANPNLGVSVRLDYIRDEAKKAKENPAYENTFRRLHLNQWTAQDERWLPMQSWDNCPADWFEFEDGEPVWSGLDLSSVRDFTAFASVSKTDKGYRCKVHYWLPQNRLDYLGRKHNIAVEKWIAAGWITPIPGDTIHYEPIIHYIAEQARRVDQRGVAYDPWNAHAVRLELEDNHGITMVECRQGFKTMSSPSKELERLVVEGDLGHGGDPVLRWMADNVAVRRDESGNLMPKKGRDQAYSHIDGIVALIMAIGEAEADLNGSSIYSEPGAMAW